MPTHIDVYTLRCILEIHVCFHFAVWVAGEEVGGGGEEVRGGGEEGRR